MAAVVDDSRDALAVTSKERGGGFHRDNTMKKLELFAVSVCCRCRYLLFAC